MPHLAGLLRGIDPQTTEIICKWFLGHESEKAPRPMYCSAFRNRHTSACQLIDAVICCLLRRLQRAMLSKFRFASGDAPKAAAKHAGMTRFRPAQLATKCVKSQCSWFWWCRKSLLVLLVMLLAILISTSFKDQATSHHSIAML